MANFGANVIMSAKDFCADGSSSRSSQGVGEHHHWPHHSHGGHKATDLLVPVVPAAPVFDSQGAQVSGELDSNAVRAAWNFTVRQRLHLFLEDPDYSLAARVFSLFILCTIVASIACFVFETVPEWRDAQIFKIVEPVTTVIFTLEYLSRFFVCDAFPVECYGYTSKCNFIKNPLNILDLLAILPYWLEAAAAELMRSAQPLRVLRSVRLIRCFRIFKLSKYSLGMTIMVESVMNSVQPLSVLTFFLCIGVVLTSSLMFYAERAGCPDIKAKIAMGTFKKYSEECLELDTGWTLGDATYGMTGLKVQELCCNEHGSALDFESISQSFWWAVVTMTTVGYGDQVPRTLLGRLVGTLAMISGIILISLPVAIVGSKFQQAYEEMELEMVKDEPRKIERMATDASQKSKVAEKQDEVKVMYSELPTDSPTKAKHKDEEAAFPESLARSPSPTPLSESSAAASASPARLPPPSSLLNPGTASAGAQVMVAATPESSMHVAFEPVDTSQFEQIGNRLKSLEKLDGLSEKATDELALLLEMFDHLERVDKQLNLLREKDKALDLNIRKEFLSVSKAFDQHTREKGT